MWPRLALGVIAALVGGCGGDKGPDEEAEVNAPAEEQGATANATTASDTVTEEARPASDGVPAGAERAALRFIVLLNDNRNRAACQLLEPSLRKGFLALYRSCPRGIEGEAPVGEGIRFDRPVVRTGEQRGSGDRARVRIEDPASGWFAHVKLADTAQGWRVASTFPYIGEERGARPSEEQSGSARAGGVSSCGEAILGGTDPQWRRRSSVTGPFGLYGPGTDPRRWQRRGDKFVTKLPAIVARGAVVTLRVARQDQGSVTLGYSRVHGHVTEVTFKACPDRPQTAWPGELVLENRGPVTLIVMAEGRPRGSIRLGRAYAVAR